MSSILITNLTQINLIKTDIKNAIINKGQNVTNFASYPNAILNISGGSGSAYQYNYLEDMYRDAPNRSNGDIGVVYTNSQLTGVYQHNGTNFNLVDSGFGATSETVWNGLFYGADGVQNGALQQTTNLTLQQLINRVNVYNIISELNMDTEITDLSYFCNSYDTNIISFPSLNTYYVTNMQGMFSNCYNLNDVGILDYSNVTDISQMFSNCNNLSNESYANIANGLPEADHLTNKYIANIGLNINKFTNEQLKILNIKGYIDAINPEPITQNYYEIQWE